MLENTGKLEMKIQSLYVLPAWIIPKCSVRRGKLSSVIFVFAYSSPPIRGSCWKRKFSLAGAGINFPILKGTPLHNGTNYLHKSTLV